MAVSIDLHGAQCGLLASARQHFSNTYCLFMYYASLTSVYRNGTLVGAQRPTAAPATHLINLNQP